MTNPIKNLTRYMAENPYRDETEEDYEGVPSVSQQEEYETLMRWLMIEFCLEDRTAAVIAGQVMQSDLEDYHG